jgi:small subunit ribosomal protein S12
VSTSYQRIRYKTKKKKAHKRSPGLTQNPQVRGITMRARIVTPRKPNSARRPVAKIVLSNGKRVTSHIPGPGHNVRRHSEILVRGGGARDLPGVRYTCIRGVYDLVGVLSKIRRRSIYGVKLPSFLKKKLKRKYRNL